MSTAYFVSDAHFGAGTPDEEREKQRRFFSFLQTVAAPGNELYILGDLFDFWFEYNGAVIRRHYPVLHRLSNAVEAGLNITYTAGNHDFWLGTFLTDDIGITVEPDAAERTVQGKRIFMAHGDGMLPGKDNGYKLLKKILRNRLNIRLFRLIHPDLGLWLADHSSLVSRRFLSRDKKKDFRTDYRDLAAGKLNKDGFDAVLLGHSHYPLFEETDGRVYANTGNWIKDFSYVELRDGKFGLKFWGKDA